MTSQRNCYEPTREPLGLRFDFGRVLRLAYRDFREGARLPDLFYTAVFGLVGWIAEGSFVGLFAGILGPMPHFIPALWRRSIQEYRRWRDDMALTSFERAIRQLTIALGPAYEGFVKERNRKQHLEAQLRKARAYLATLETERAQAKIEASSARQVDEAWRPIISRYRTSLATADAADRSEGGTLALDFARELRNSAMSATGRRYFPATLSPLVEMIASAESIRVGALDSAEARIAELDSQIEATLAEIETRRHMRGRNPWPELET